MYSTYLCICLYTRIINIYNKRLLKITYNLFLITAKDAFCNHITEILCKIGVVYFRNTQTA